MLQSVVRCLVGSLAIGLSVAAPAPEKKLSPRERAGIPLAQHVIPVKAVKNLPNNVTPVGAVYQQLPGAADLGFGPPAVGTGTAVNAAKQVEYLIDAQIGGKNYSLIIDTGSTDTWVVKTPFKCLDMMFRLPTLEENCKFGPMFKGDFPQGSIPNVRFDIAYGYQGGPFLQGSMGYSDVKVAGIDLPKQQIALAETGAWQGDEISSGILGLGLPALTAAVNPQGQPVNYDGFVTTMVKEGIAPVFALALSRDKRQSFLSFGGVPDIATGEYGTTKILQHTTGGYSRYVIEIDALTINGTQNGAKSNVRPIPAPFLLDSGTTLNIFPTSFANFINANFDPPAVYDPNEDAYFTACNAKPPVLTFEIGGANFVTDPESMILPQVTRADGKCATGITDGHNSDMFILGDTFLQELVVVFDISEKMEVRIAHRKD